MNRLKKNLKRSIINPYRDFLLANLKKQMETKNSVLKEILIWLSGKKSVIAGLITTTAAYLVNIEQINAETGAYIAAISLIIFGTASIATGKIVYNK